MLSYHIISYLSQIFKSLSYQLSYFKNFAKDKKDNFFHFLANATAVLQNKKIFLSFCLFYLWFQKILTLNLIDLIIFCYFTQLYYQFIFYLDLFN